ncbi:MAG: hypothetical protein RLZZ546_2486 [Bacteroidota bacterium]|jgi:hypothetical protein
MNKAYIINFDKGGFFNYQKFHKTLTTADGIISWWHYLESSYIVITNRNTSATNVSEFVRANMPDKHFFVCELNLKNHDGWLPQEAWDWINKNKPFI